MIHNRPFLRSLVVATAIMAAAGFYGCQNGSSPGPQGFAIPDRAMLKPDKLALSTCKLELAGTEYSAEIRQVQEGDQIQIDLLAHGQVIESERYQSTNESFSLVNAGGEQCDPPIPLIRYGMTVGDSWDWKGRTLTGPAPHAATAQITTSAESLTIKGQTLPKVVRIDVNLAIESGVPDSPVPRKLSFWIAPEMGVVKRSYDNYSTRLPPVE